jgi:prepilin-type N-terminal cleavage/methylation domain-containing protein
MPVFPVDGLKTPFTIRANQKAGLGKELPIRVNSDTHLYGHRRGRIEKQIKSKTIKNQRARLKMKTNRLKETKSKESKAFTLIEMIGVLAVIAILAALLIPKIFEAINNARVNNAAVSYNTVKAAIADHYAKFGSILSSNGVISTLGTSQATNFDRVLITEGFLDKPFHVKLAGGGTNSYVRIIAADPSPATAATAINNAYDLDRGGDANDAVGGVVVEAIIEGATQADAKDLNDRLDGAALGTLIGTPDTFGRVKYAAASPTTIYIYLTHR